MNKMIVTVFNNESSAYEGVKALTQLHAEGSLTMYATAVIAKDAKGVVSVKQAADEGPLGTALGFTTGSLIGLLGGPIGLALGAATGALAGSLYDIAQLGIGEDFVAEVTQYLLPGKVAVVAEIDEEWVTPLDTRMDALGGIVFRRARGEFIDAQIEREIAADKAEIAKLKAEYDQEVGEAKAKLKAKLDAAQNRLQTRRDLLNERIEAIKREGEAKVKSLQEQAAQAKGEAKAKLENRIAEERANHKLRVAKLSQAWQLVKEAAAI
ncbi:MAG: DUF1269 domain-containing protein [Acidobacteria bacterium]|nr:DUF1269 domain-containing protein [Acidobacteriota bacterium]